MIDLHCHILPYLDDGARNMDETLSMLQIAVQSGVKSMVATPHCEHGGTDEILSIYKRVCKVIKDRQIPLNLYLGMEIFATQDTVDLLYREQLLTLNGSRYPLIEFDFLAKGRDETEILEDLLQEGYRPLIAHPERYLFLQRNPDLMNLWWQMGCLFQINRGSLLGRFGMEAQQLSLAMIDRGFATVVASDGHSCNRRTPWLEHVRHMLHREFSPNAALHLLERNPAKILNNEDLTQMEIGRAHV